MFWWWRKKTSRLPYPEGPYGTGCTEIMNNYSKDSIFIRLMYPTDVHPADVKKRSKDWIEWLADSKYIEAFADLLHIWIIVMKIIMLFVKKTYIPTLWEEPVSRKIKKFPVVVFSHGYGATRFLCSTLCNELASRGYIVAAIEHKDLSASITYYYDSESSRDKNRKTYIHHIPFRTEAEDHYTTRNKQLKKRSAECSNVLNLLSEINDGKCVNILKSNFDEQSLKGKIDLSNCVVMGHSFGGATTMYTLSSDKRFKFGVILDGWMFPLKEEQLQISQPMLFINSHTFHIEPNIKLMMKFSTLPQSELYTIKNTTHESNTDTPILYGHWLNIFMKKLECKTALQIQNYLILDFLRKHADLEVEEEIIKNYLKLQESNLVNDFLRFAKTPQNKFTIL